MNWDYPHPFTNNIIVQSSDIDGLGHTNNACYVVWCEDCAWKHSESLGLSVLDYQKMDRGVAIHRASYNYYLPSFENEELVVGTWLTGCDNKLRLQRRFQIANPNSGETVLRGVWDLISVTLSSSKPTRFPREFLEIYGAAVITAAAS